MQKKYNPLVQIIRIYQFFISPLLGNNCRFHPSCSEYAKNAIIKHGSIKGAWLSVKRLIRCNPWFGNDID